MKDSDPVITTKSDGAIWQYVKPYIKNNFVVSLLDNVFTKQNISYTNYLRGPKFNFEILEQLEKQNLPTKTADIDLFFKHVIPLLKLKPNAKICVFTHGLYITKLVNTFESQITINDNDEQNKESCKDKAYLKNTEVVEMVLSNNKAVDTIIYTPESLRNIYENFEKLNIDVCHKNSLQGSLNIPIYNMVNMNPNVNSGKLEPYSGTLEGHNAESKNDIIKRDNISRDMKFAFSNTYQDQIKDTYYDPNIKNTKVIAGGSGVNYKAKYLKYKMKYLNLK